MFKIGLTGGMGSGKSYVALVFEHLGISIFNSDIVGKEALLQPDIIAKVIATFGSIIIDNKGEINKAVLSEIVFKNADSLKQLTNITHPYIINAFSEFCKQHSRESYIINEAAILLESGFSKGVDKIICVSAPQQIRINRILNRDNISLEKIKQRMQLQFTDEERRKLSDYEIINDDANLILPQVLKLHSLFIHGNFA